MKKHIVRDTIVVSLALLVIIFSIILIAHWIPQFAEEVIDPVLTQTPAEPIITVADDIIYYKEPTVFLSEKTGNITCSFSENNEYITVMGYSEYPILIKKDKHTLSSFRSNEEGTAFAATVKQKDEYVIYYSDGEEIKKIYEPNISVGSISNNNTIFWATGKTGSNNGTLKMMKDGKITVLTENLSSFVDLDIPVFQFWNSEDGNTVFWYENYVESKSTYTTCLYKDGETAPLGENVSVLEVSENADKIYYKQYDKLYLQNGFDTENRILITENIDSESTVNITYSNLDNSQIIYTIYENVLTTNGSYFYQEGEEPLFLAEGPINLETPVKVADFTDLRGYIYSSRSNDLRYDIYYFGDTFEPILEAPVESIFAFSVTKDFLYETSENLYLYDSETKQSTAIFEKTNQITYAAKPDLSEIYVSEITGYGGLDTLYRVMPDGEKSVIAENVIDSFTDGNSVYYITAENELFNFKNNDTQMLIKIIESDIYEIECGLDTSGYYFVKVTKEDENYSIETINYLSADGENFLKIEEG
jgi:hypothetical protein